jgi:hypothetical protein
VKGEDKMEFKWEMEEKDWKKLVLDNRARHTKRKLDGNNVYGEVKVGYLNADIVHTMDKSDWYAFSNVFALGKDEGYGETESGVPYALLNGSPKVPIRCKSFDSFKRAFEKNFEEYINQNEETKELVAKPIGKWL